MHSARNNLIILIPYPMNKGGKSKKKSLQVIIRLLTLRELNENIKEQSNLNCFSFVLQILNEIAQHKIRIYEFPDCEDEEELKAQKRLRVYINTNNSFAMIGFYQLLCVKTYWELPKNKSPGRSKWQEQFPFCYHNLELTP